MAIVVKELLSVAEAELGGEAAIGVAGGNAPAWCDPWRAPEFPVAYDDDEEDDEDFADDEDFEEGEGFEESEGDDEDFLDDTEDAEEAGEEFDDDDDDDDDL